MITHDVTSLGKLCGEWDKVDVPASVPINCDGSNDDKLVFHHEMVPGNNNITNDYSIVSNNLDSKEEENLLNKQINEVP